MRKTPRRSSVKRVVRNPHNQMFLKVHEKLGGTYARKGSFFKSTRGGDQKDTRTGGRVGEGKRALPQGGTVGEVRKFRAQNCHGEARRDTVGLEVLRDVKILQREGKGKIYILKYALRRGEERVRGQYLQGSPPQKLTGGHRSMLFRGK